MMRRGLGAIVALLAASLPCSLLAVAMSAGYDALATNPWFHAALRGALAAAVAISKRISTVWIVAGAAVTSLATSLAGVW
jgi:chromate transporter